MTLPVGEVATIFGRVVVRNLRDIGLEVRPESIPATEFYQGLREGRFELFGTGSIANAPDPDELLYSEFHTGAVSNYSGFSDEEVDRLTEAGRSVVDPGRRSEIYEQAHQRLLEQLPCSAFYHARIAVLVQPRWSGTRFSVSPFPIVERTLLPEAD